jgi:hypothetical protein
MDQPMIRTGAILLLMTLGLSVLLCGGCLSGGEGDYTNRWLYPDDVSTVYVEMFDTGGFRRGHEYDFTDALCKRIESETPYKIVSDRNRADTLISGTVQIRKGVLATDRYEGRPLEYETYAEAMITWKNLKTGDILVDREKVIASASYAPKLDQDLNEASKVALNRAAEKAVELMEIGW